MYYVHYITFCDMSIEEFINLKKGLEGIVSNKDKIELIEKFFIYNIEK